ncbi:MAG: hypothetical protein IT445_04835 [Phycisphaeraceae bacterium]|nr:hypothetical protein [Phycisphaeraceae bacterium]
MLGNVGFLAVDVFIAHAINAFRVWTQWIPVAFSLVGPVVMVVGMLANGLRPQRGTLGDWLGRIVGAGSILVGVAGLILHLESHFFKQQTLANLVYAAPFVAPLSYTGLGLLLLMNRMVDRRSWEWAQWVLLLAWGGFVGNFGLSLTDHAQNGFFNVLEWVPVFTAALAVGFFLLAIWMPDGGYRAVCVVVLLLQCVVGMVGFGLHLWRDVTGPMSGLVENFLYGAPIFAPLLFVNLSVLGGLGLWARQRCEEEDQVMPQAAAQALA